MVFQISLDYAPENANRKRNFCKISLCAVPFFQCRLRPWRNRGNMKKKYGRLIFIEGEKSGGTFSRRGHFWNVVPKGGLSLSPSIQREILCQLEDIQYMYILYIYIYYIYIYIYIYTYIYIYIHIHVIHVYGFSAATGKVLSFEVTKY